MKKILSLFMLIVGSAHVFGQVKMGVKAGTNFSNSRFDGAQTNYKFGYQGGITTDIVLGKVFLIRPEILYARKGFVLPSSDGEEGGRMSFHYINMPILFGIKPVKMFSVYAGPELGFLVKAIARFDNENHDRTSLYKRKDFGISAGTCFYISKAFAVEARYAYGFDLLFKITMTDATGATIDSFRDGGNRSLQLSLNYYPSWKKLME